jgi:hypothetical protein
MEQQQQQMETAAQQPVAKNFKSTSTYEKARSVIVFLHMVLNYIIC